MANFKGRQLAFLLLVFGGWSIARVAILSIPDDAGETRSKIVKNLETPSTSVALTRQYIPALEGFSTKLNEAAVIWPATAVYTTSPKDSAKAQSKVPPFMPAADEALANFASSITVLQAAKDDRIASEVGNDAKRSRFQIYAYSYWRWSNQSTGLAAAGQYGGSQSGLIATYSLVQNRRPEDSYKLAALFRAAIAPNSRSDREVALGLRWRPVSALPVTLTAERRFRPEGQDRIAAYIAGGVDSVKLPARFALDFYGQAGVVSGRAAGPFFDASVHAYRPVYQLNRVSTHIGGGLWAGGQSETARVDVGPSISVDSDIADTHFRLSADWRFRVAGNVRPGNGPALTLSTGF